MTDVVVLFRGIQPPFRSSTGGFGHLALVGVALHVVGLHLPVGSFVSLSEGGGAGVLCHSAKQPGRKTSTSPAGRARHAAGRKPPRILPAQSVPTGQAPS